MECNSYLDEKIGETDSEEFREHRAGCAGCRRDLEELREVRRLYQSASVESYRGAAPRPRTSRGAWIPMAAAAALLLGVLALTLGGPRSPAVPPTDTGSASTVFVRLPLEPWASDRRVSDALDDCWEKLKQLEEKR